MTESLAYEALCRTEQLDGDTVRILREDVDMVEEKLCVAAEAEHCVLAADGHAALLLALGAAGVRWGDKVLCSGFAPREIARTILLAGGVPELVDIHPNTFNLDPYCLRYTVGRCVRTQQPVPKVLVANDLFGLPCNYQALEEVCEEYGITLVRYIGEALGARPPGEPFFWGRFAVLAFPMDPGNPEEGEGGAVLCDTQEDEDILRELGSRQCHLEQGDALARDTVLAGLLLHRMTELREALPRRRELAACYTKALGGRLRLQQEPESYLSAWTDFAVSLPASVDRELLLERMAEHSLPCGYYEPCSLDNGQDWEQVSLLHTAKARDRLIRLPLHHHITDGVAREIAGRLVEEVDRQVAQAGKRPVAAASPQ